MISDETRSRIRRLYFAEHWKINTIATELGVHHETVELALCRDRFANHRFSSGPTKLDPYRAFIQQTLEQYPRLRSTRLFEMVKTRGYDGSIGTLRRYVRRVRPGRVTKLSSSSPFCPASKPRWTGARSARSESAEASAACRAS